jgi:serine/threonine-protein kinase
VDDARQTCPSCGLSDGETRLASSDPDMTRLAGPGAAAPSPTTSRGPKTGSHSRSGKSLTSSSWLTSTAAIDHGRFEPGTLLDERYRIVGRLGKGGMGEVYRADDLKLGQQVALKFLSETVDADPARLTQLHTEVRMARQVSHPNVCRVYDAGEFDGHTFLSMEYVDGEDLASLIRRIGRFPQDRAIELARQICAGLAAAHDRGVVHRDLKPANIMLDGSGKIRITDFGLAGATGEVLRAGTPAYMAPEQLAGGEVTPRSDVYALGLVLYELFTGRRALDAANMAELIAKREQADITLPTDIVRDLDPGIERIVMRCLEPDPARRPGSALGVSAALPGGDPLAAALAAGETPSPELVAASGSTEALAVSKVAPVAAVIVVAALAVLFIYQRVQMINIVPLPKPPAALVDRAQEIAQKLGVGDDVRSTASGFAISVDWARYIERTTTEPGRWNKLRTTRPETYAFWYRTSPVPLLPFGWENTITALDPPLIVSGMTLVVVDGSGRLAEFVGVPSAAEPAGPPAKSNWAPLFEAAGLQMSAFTPATPKWRPPVYADERAAWEGPVPEVPGGKLRVEAAAAGGRPVFFGIAGPWTVSSRDPATRRQPTTLERATGLITALVMPGLMLVGALLARRNVKLGRGDRRGAFRAAAAVFFLILLAWLLGDTHVGSMSAELSRFFARVGIALFNAGVLWLTYLGLEPYVRRFSPDSLIGWTRLVAGGWRDPRVGRDVMIGVAAGLVMTVVFAVHNLLPPLFGLPEPMPVLTDPSSVMSARFALAGLVNNIQNALTSGMLGIGGFVAFRILTKRRWAAALIAVVVFSAVVINGMFSPGPPAIDLTLGLLITIGFVAVIGWAGLLATIATLATHFILLRAPMTTDLSLWWAPTGLIYIGFVLALGLGGCYLAAQDAPRAASRFG